MSVIEDGAVRASIRVREVDVPTVSLEEMQQDRLVMSVARAVALANETAIAQGTELANSLVTISEEGSPDERVWRIHYGPRDFVGRRGGDLIVLVDERSEAVQRVIRGQ